MGDFNPQLLFYNTQFDYAVWALDEQNSAFNSDNQQIKESESESKSQKTLQAKVADPKLTCKGCKKTLTTEKRFEIHCVCCKKFAVYESELFTCRRCKRKFEKRTSLKKHFRKHHSSKNDNPQRPEDVSKKSSSNSIFHNISLLAESDSRH